MYKANLTPVVAFSLPQDQVTCDDVCSHSVPLAPHCDSPFFIPCLVASELGEGIPLSQSDEAPPAADPGVSLIFPPDL